MKAVVQRVDSGSVTVDGRITGAIGPGIVILLGVTHDDRAKDVEFLADKCANLRIFQDENRKMNRSLLDIDGEALVVSQFTLYGDAAKGRRPSFTAAAAPELAESLYEEFILKMKQKGVKKVACGKFAADMLLDIKNNGPVTIIIESK